MNIPTTVFISRFPALAVLLGASFTLASCGGGSKSVPPPLAPVTVASVGVSVQTVQFVTSAEAAKGVAVRFQANVTMSNRTVVDGTATVAWTSSDTAVLAFETPSVPGLATARKQGPVTVTATETGGTPGTLAYTVVAPAPVGLAIDPAQLPNGVPVGQEGNFKATYTLTDKTTKDATMEVDWKSSNGGAVVVGNDAGNKGKAIAIGVGASNISASKGTLLISQDAAVTVLAPPAPPQFVIEPPSPDQLPLGRTQQFKALLKYPDSKVVNVTERVAWQSSAENFAKFPADWPKGLLLASPTAAGAATITAQDPATSAMSTPVTVTVSNTAIESVAITPVATATDTLPVGLSRQLGVVATYADKIARDITQTVNWTTTGGDLLSVNDSFGSKGLVKSNRERTTTEPKGAVVITDPISSQSVNVEIDTGGRTLDRIEISPASKQSVALGHTVQFQATAVYSDTTSDPVTNQVTWESSGGDKVAISNAKDSKGKATALALGDSVISAAVEIDGKTVISDNRVVVTASAAVLETVEIKPATAVSLALGRTQKLTADGIFSDGSRQDISGVVNWRSGNAGTVSVGNSGKEKGVVRGEMTGGPVSITATEPRTSRFASKPVSVTGKTFDGIVINPVGTTSRPIGVPFKDYVAIADYSDGSGDPITEDVQWKSSDPTIATVSNEAGSRGHIFPQKVGDVQVTASAEALDSAPVTFSVLPAVLASIAITPSDPQGIMIDETVKFTAEGTYSDASKQDITEPVTWQSDDRSKVFITNSDPNGTAVGTGPGLANITATQDGVKSGDRLRPVTEVVVSGSVNFKTAQEVALGCCEGIQVSMDGKVSDFDGTKNYRFTDATAGIPIEWSGNEIPSGIDVRVTGVPQGSKFTVSNWTPL